MGPAFRSSGARVIAPIRAVAIAFALGAVAPHDVHAYVAPASEPDPRGPQTTLRQDGKIVQNVGRLQLNLTNIGETGNGDYGRLSTTNGAEWPAGSGHEYLFAAGLWVGAIDASGVPHVTTANQPNREFSPELTPDHACAPVPIDRVADIRESYEGIPGGNRVISASVDPDDDGDGLVDEDF